MIEQAIVLIIYVLLFALVAYGLHAICVYFGMPQPVLWICGALLLIILLVFVSQHLGVGTGVNLRRL